jgi:hypothetical protein
MRIFQHACKFLPLLALNTLAVLGAEDAIDSASHAEYEICGEDASRTEAPTCSTRTGASVCLSANDLSIATGTPSLVLMSSGSTYVPVWSLSGGTPGQSVAGVINGFSNEFVAVKVEIVVTTTDEGTSSDFQDVYRVHLSQLSADSPFAAHSSLSKPVRTSLPAAAGYTRTIVLESYREVEPNVPLVVRIQREPADPGNTFLRPVGLAMVIVTPLKRLATPDVVQDVAGYNSWPMIQMLEKKMVCAYSRGSAHTIDEDARAVYARTSMDGGRTWTDETTVANTPGSGEVAVGKGLDSEGAMLLWVRRIGKEWNHDLYRTKDGLKFTLLATPKLAVQPMQITDIFTVPQVGLMALWFAGNYRDEPKSSWGTLTSSDQGISWTQTTVESGLTKADWPTEPAAVSLGNGRILAIARTETGPSQFQITSTDSGRTWKRSQTNISDVAASTPALILDTSSGLLSNYYYERGRGILRRRVVVPDRVFDHPLDWPASEAVAIGSSILFDAGNANATAQGGAHFVTFYSGKAPQTSVLLSIMPAPTAHNR